MQNILLAKWANAGEKEKVMKNLFKMAKHMFSGCLIKRHNVKCMIQFMSIPPALDSFFAFPLHGKCIGNGFSTKFKFQINSVNNKQNWNAKYF